MEKHFGSGILLGAGGFDLAARVPLDYRLIYLSWNESDLSDIPITRLYVGMIVSDEATGTAKILKSIPDGATNAYQCVWEEVGKEYIHPGITPTVSTSSVTLAHSGSFLAVTTLSVDSSGHLSSINVSTLTLPASGNTDFKVSTTTSNSSVYLSGATTTALTTASLYVNASVYMAAGFLYSNKERVLTTASPLDSAVSDWGTIGY